MLTVLVWKDLGLNIALRVGGCLVLVERRAGVAGQALLSGFKVPKKRAVRAARSAIVMLKAPDGAPSAEFVHQIEDKLPSNHISDSNNSALAMLLMWTIANRQYSGIHPRVPHGFVGPIDCRHLPSKGHRATNFISKFPKLAP